MNASDVADALELNPAELAEIFRQEAARELRVIADRVAVAESLREITTNRATHFLFLADEFEDEWDRRHNEKGGAESSHPQPTKEANVGPATADSERSG